MQGTNGSQPPRAQRRALTEPSAPLQETSWGHGVEGSSLPRPPPPPSQDWADSWDLTNPLSLNLSAKGKWNYLFTFNWPQFLAAVLETTGARPYPHKGRVRPGSWDSSSFAGLGPASGKPGRGSVREVRVTAGSHSRLWAQV